MSVEGILIDAVLVAGVIATLTGIAVVAGLLRIAGGGGIRRAPAFYMPGVAARDRALRARLRARYRSQSGAQRIVIYRPLTIPVHAMRADERAPIGDEHPSEPATMVADPAQPTFAA